MVIAYAYALWTSLYDLFMQSWNISTTLPGKWNSRISIGNTQWYWNIMQFSCLNFFLTLAWISLWPAGHSAQTERIEWLHTILQRITILIKKRRNVWIHVEFCIEPMWRQFLNTTNLWPSHTMYTLLLCSSFTPNCMQTVNN